MSKFLIVSILLFAVGIVFFILAGNCYLSILNLHELFAHYGIQEKDYLFSNNVSEKFAQLKFGVIKFSILGTVAWILGLLFLLNRNKKPLLNK